MAVKIRLARGGAKKRPFYRVVAADERAPRDGRYGLDFVGEIEPKPGIPPTLSHLSRLTSTMRDDDIKVVVCGHYYYDRVPTKIARETGAEVYTLALMVGGVPEAGTYIDMVRHNTEMIAEGLR